MREVKFRIWDKLCGCYTHKPDTYHEFLTNGTPVDVTWALSHPENFVAQQYTNQTCDGVDIYEGDIVEAYWPDIFVGDPVRGEVIWNEHFNELLYPGWVIKTDKGLAAFPPWVRVLGNIFEGEKL